MAPRDIFGIIVRTIGVLALTAGATYLISTLIVLLSPETPHKSPLTAYVLASGVWFLLSIYLIRGAPHLVRLAYPEPPQSRP